LPPIWKKAILWLRKRIDFNPVLFFLCLRHVRQQGTNMARPFAASHFAASPLPLASLDRTGLENLFQSWRGASGRRYICSVYPVGEAPSFDCARAIVAAVRKNAEGASIAFVFQPGPEGESDGLRQWTQKARQYGADEWHVHLLAGSKEERDFALRDLAPCAPRLAA
jgi:hypothetical protein